VTLPERILGQLEAIGHDRARAIVKCVETVLNDDGNPAKKVQLVEVAPGKALIVIRPCSSLHKIAWLRLAEIAPGRHLLVLPPGTPVDSLEVALLDLIEGLAPEDSDERSLIEELRSVIGQQRRRRTVTKAELVFVDV
jgi:hypothetical protein